MNQPLHELLGSDEHQRNLADSKRAALSLCGLPALDGAVVSTFERVESSLIEVFDGKIEVVALHPPIGETGPVSSILKITRKDREWSKPIRIRFEYEPVHGTVSVEIDDVTQPTPVLVLDFGGEMIEVHSRKLFEVWLWDELAALFRAALKL